MLWSVWTMFNFQIQCIVHVHVMYGVMHEYEGEIAESQPDARSAEGQGL